MVSSFAILLGLSATFASCNAANQTTTIEDEGLACSDMAVALAKLQTLTGTPHSTYFCYTLSSDEGHSLIITRSLLSGLSRGKTVWSTTTK